MGQAIEVKDLDVFYDNVCALSKVNLTVNEKEFLGIIGPNGGGKSTLLKALLGLVKPSKGVIRVFGKAPEDISNIIGYVPQFSKFDKRFPINVNDVVLMGRLSGRKKLFQSYSHEDRKIVQNIMEELGVFSLGNRQIGQLSGGQLQRVLIARALATEPRILLLDEPTASVDTTSREQIYQLLQKLNKDITVIVVTHDMEAVSSYIKSIACLNKELHYHGGSKLDNNTIQKVYGCPIELIAHGVPHRVLDRHEDGLTDN